MSPGHIRIEGNDPPRKRVRLTIEWVGACAESVWGRVLWELIEDADVSDATRVVRLEQLTSYGRTRRLSNAELRVLGFKPRRLERGLWGALWWRLRDVIGKRRRR
jgi:hypothetical protein